MVHFPQLEGRFTEPGLAFTLNGNPYSIQILEQLKGLGRTVFVFDTPEEKEEYFLENGISSYSALALFDKSLGGTKKKQRRFRPTCRNRQITSPNWANTQWIVMISPAVKPEGCARQINADFFKNFHRNLEEKQGFPWGRAKKGETPPKPFSIPTSIQKTIASLNEGPDLAAAIADKNFAVELPKGSKISWLRIVPEPLKLETDTLNSILAALARFEEVCNDLVKDDVGVQKLLLAGVDLPLNSAIAQAYLFPKVARFSVDRPDLHYTGNGMTPFASEIDEMPGGLPELVHLDFVYGINQDRWRQAFDWLCQEGPLIFLVSHQWSECYIPQTKWLVEHLQGLGYPARIVTTDEIDQVEIRDNGLYLTDERIGTIWRQFPIFEAKGKVADIVMAAYEGRVRMVPELAHFGNKAWFSVFRSHEDFYRDRMTSVMFDLLEKVLPHSHVVSNDVNPFPIVMGDITIASLEALENLDQPTRDWLVLKVCGANNLAARSYGVLMGLGIKQGDWSKWIDDRLKNKQPFVVQTRLEQGTGQIPVMNTKTMTPELFSCRVLARPWTINGQLVSVHGCAVPSQFFKVHGMVDMAIVPFTF